MKQVKPVLVDGRYFYIQQDWKEVLGEDVLSLKVSVSQRLRELNIDRDKFYREAKKNGDFVEWFDLRVQKTISARRAVLEKGDSAKQKREATMLERYGASCSFNVESCLAKKRKTLTEKFGGDSPFYSKQIKEKIKQDSILKYGVSNPALSEISIEKRSTTHRARFSKTQEDLKAHLRKYGILPLDEIDYLNKSGDYKGRCLTCGKDFVFHFMNRNRETPTSCPYCNEKSSVLERSIVRLLEEKGFKTVPHYREAFVGTEFEGKEIDIYLPEFKAGIEINGIYSHNSSANLYSLNRGTLRPPKSKTYHLKKTELALRKGIKLYHLWNHRQEDLEQILSILSKGFIYPKEDVFEIRRDLHPDKPKLDGYCVSWKEEKWTTDKSGKRSGDLETFTSGIWVCTRY